MVETGFPPFTTVSRRNRSFRPFDLFSNVPYERIETLEQNLAPTWAGLLQPLEDLDIPFEYSWGVVSHLMGVKNSEALRKAHTQVLPEIVQFGLRIKQSPAIYQGLLAIRDGDAWDKLDEAQQRIIEQKIRDAKHAGVGLNG